MMKKQKYLNYPKIYCVLALKIKSKLLMLTKRVHFILMKNRIWTI